MVTALVGEFEKANPSVRVVLGGDGSLVSAWRSASADGKLLLPVRDYARCPECDTALEELLTSPEKFAERRRELKMTLHRLLEFKKDGGGIDDGGVRTALSEATAMTADPTECMRFDVEVNGEKIYDNVVASGFVVATPFGSTGYFGSIARTVFRDGFGVAFVAPTVGVNNLVLGAADTVKVAFRRGVRVNLAADKDLAPVSAAEGDEFSFGCGSDKVAILGLKEFHCPACRALRHGTRICTQYLK